MPERGEAHRRASMVREHIDNATDAEIGARVRALAERGFVGVDIVPKPEWMERDHFLPVGELDERDTMFGMTREQWRRLAEATDG